MTHWEGADALPWQWFFNTAPLSHFPVCFFFMVLFSKRLKRKVSVNKASISSVIEMPEVAGHFLKNRPCCAIHVCSCPSFVSESETSRFWHQRACHSRRWNTWWEMHFLRMVALCCPWRELCSLNFQFNISIFPLFFYVLLPIKTALSDESMSWKSWKKRAFYQFLLVTQPESHRSDNGSETHLWPSFLKQQQCTDGDMMLSLSTDDAL